MFIATCGGAVSCVALWYLPQRWAFALYGAGMAVFMGGVVYFS